MGMSVKEARSIFCKQPNSQNADKYSRIAEAAYKSRKITPLDLIGVCNDIQQWLLGNPPRED